MKIIEKNTFGDDTFYILEMDAQDKEAISEHIGDVNGNYIMYNGLSAINDSTLSYPRIRVRQRHEQQRARQRIGLQCKNH